MNKTTPSPAHATKQNDSLTDQDKIRPTAGANHQHDADSGDDMVGEVSEWEKERISAGNAKFSRLGWKRLTIVLIVQAIALGSLSLPSAFATLGLVAGVILCITIGLIAVYTAYLIGLVKIANPHVAHYPDAMGLVFGRIGSEATGVMLCLLLLFLVASHCLTGTIAFLTITESSVCTLVWGVVSALILVVLAIPPSFAEVAILGYIDFGSIMVAILLTMIATGVKASNAEGGLSAVDWSAWPKEDLAFTDAFIAGLNIFFAYSFSISMFSFMDEMHTPTDYMKSIWSLGIIEIVVYTLTGSLIYVFVGTGVKSPALLSAGHTISKIGFGLAFPVIFISGSICTTVAARYIHGRIYQGTVTQYVNTKKGWLTWLATISVITLVAWIVAEAIPFFSTLLAITASLLNAGFTLYLPAIMWFALLRKGKWSEPKNIMLGLWNGFLFLLGILITVCGTYASVKDIIDQYKNGTVKSAFTCSSLI